MIQFYNDSSTRATLETIESCGTYPTGHNIPWSVIAEDWVKGGGRKEDCAAALIIATGETSCTKSGCLSVESGIWQVTSPDMPAPSGCKDGSTNVCCTVDYVRNHLHTRVPGSKKSTSWQVGCIGEFNNGGGWDHDPRNDKFKPPISTPIPIEDVVPPIVPSDHSGAGLGGTQSNWIGPFCHQGGFSCQSDDPYCHSKGQTGISGDNWGGGSVWAGSVSYGSQIYPYPYYYYARFLESQGDGKGMTGEIHCHSMPMPGSKVGACGGIPSKNVPDCPQPVNGKAPSADAQKCYDRITNAAIVLAEAICQESILRNHH